MKITFEDLTIKQKPTETKKVEFAVRGYVDGKAAFYVRDDGQNPRYFFPCNGSEGQELLDAARKELDVDAAIDAAVVEKLAEKKVKPAPLGVVKKMPPKSKAK